jgi:hypothetical protein
VTSEATKAPALRRSRRRQLRALEAPFTSSSAATDRATPL